MLGGVMPTCNTIGRRLGSLTVFLKHSHREGHHLCRIYRRSLHVSSYLLNAYEKAFERSVTDPEDFWAESAQQLVWHKRWTSVLDNSNPPFTKWFKGGEISICYNAIDRHVEAGHGDMVAIIHDSPVTKSIVKITYKELLDKVSKFAGVLRKHGVNKGDQVVIYMPMIPEAVVAMLASARIGANHSLVFGGFASKELSTRIDHAKPKVIISANCGVEPKRVVPYKPMLEGALQLIDFKPNKCIIFNRPLFERAPTTDMYLDWDEEVAASQGVDCVPVPAMDPVYFIYTSGTTGLPKAVVRPAGGYAVVMKWSMKALFNINPGETWWAASDLGWVVGHSYIAYAPLLNQNTTVLFEGKPVGTPDSTTYFRVIKEHNVSGMFTAPTALRAIRGVDPNAEKAKKYMPLDSLRAVFAAGEHLDHETLEWARKIFGKPILDHWWQTESGWPITCSCMGLDMDPYPPAGYAGKPVPGWNVKVMVDGRETKPLELGQIVVKLPLPPGSFSTLWHADDRFKETYFEKFPGYYDTMDSGFRDKNGYIAVMARTDDVINVAGHRLSTGAIEEAMLQNSDVVEAAVVPVPDEIKGQIPLGLCVVKNDCVKSNTEVVHDTIRVVREVIGPVAAFKLVVIVPNLPKTRSGKVARNTIAAMAANKPFKIPVTIEDDSVYGPISQQLEVLGFKTSQPIRGGQNTDANK